jgi:cell surface protein SprA
MSAFNNIPIPDSTKSKIKDQIIDYTERKGFNISNFRIDGLKRKKAKPMPLDISNFSATYAYNENFKRSINIEYNINKQYRGNLQYSYSFKNPIVFKPFSKIKLFENKWFTLIKDFSFLCRPK